jgi:hypothetical protein
MIGNKMTLIVLVTNADAASIIDAPSAMFDQQQQIKHK